MLQSGLKAHNFIARQIFKASGHFRFARIRKMTQVSIMTIIYRTRKLVKPGDLNPRNTLFGGRLLEWIDEECAVYAACQIDSQNLVTKYMSALNFRAPAFKGDVVEIGVTTKSVGYSSITVECHVRVKHTKEEIISVDEIVFVNVDDKGRPLKHGKHTKQDSD